MISFKKMCEDTQMVTGDRYVAGIASRDLKANPITLNGLFGNQGQNPNNVKVNRAVPFELTNVYDLSEHIFLCCDELYSKLSQANTNPTIKKKGLYLKFAKLLTKKIFELNKKLALALRKLVES